ncbi:MAG: Arginase [Caulobacteraceae bacterium]|nr:Arginase [Caulobacteraceae bacterium]
MRPAVLHLDTALDAQPGLAQAVAERAGSWVDCRDLGPALRLWSRPGALGQLRDRLRTALPAAMGPLATFSGSGDFHHITPLLLARAIEAAGDPTVTLIHFDNHPDWVTFADGAHCGSWVGCAARLPQVARVLTVGVCSDDIRQPERKRADLALVAEDKVELYAYRAPDGGPRVAIAGREWATIEAMGEAAFVDFLATRIATPAIYVTIDKDVLRAQDGATNWDQGRTSLGFLAAMLSRIAAGHRLIGADIVGDWSTPVYGGGPVTRLLKRGEAMLDQPWLRPSAGARAAGAATNLVLLGLFTGRCG